MQQPNSAAVNMADFKEFERSAWEAKAHRYNSTWGTVSNQAIEPVLDAGHITAGMTLLDLGCGPGHLTAAAARRGADPVGCDLSTGMIAIARENYPKLDFRQGDAESLEFADGTFDLVVMNFLLLHVPDQNRVILEAKRVLKPGGRLIFSVWLGPGRSPGLRLMFEAVKAFADMNVIPPAQDIFMFAEPEFAEQTLTADGFSAIEFAEIDAAWEVSTGKQFFEAVQAGTRIGGLIDLQKPEIKSQIEEQILERIEEFKSAGGYYIPTPALVISADKSP